MVNTINRLLLLTITLCISLASTTINAEAVAEVDRSVVAVDESLVLTLSLYRNSSVKTLDLTGIRSNFHIVGNNQSSRHTYRNGQSESIMEWQITLIPKHVGQLIIPAIIIDGDKTEPITIDVRPAVPLSEDKLLPVYLESQLDHDSVYVQQQIVYTLRVFQSIQLDNMNVSEPDIDNAVVKKLSQQSYQRRIKNTPYRVHELRYAIFPQQSGELIIPEAVFSANEVVARRSIFNLPGQGRAIRKLSQQHTVIVKDIPKQFTGSVWLPAQSIRLEQSFIPTLKQLHVGESITRSITIHANGLLDSQLPPVKFPATPGVKYYPDKAQTQSNESEQGISSSRTDSTALIPTQQGTLTLPQVRIVWWDTTIDEQREALIPASTLNIVPALNDDASITTAKAVDHSQTSPDTEPTNPPVAPTQHGFWPIISAMLAAAWIITLFMWWNVKRQLTAQAAQTVVTDTAPLSEKQAYKTLATLCHNNDIGKLRQALLDWAQSYWPNHTIGSLQDIARLCDHQPLNNVLLQLDNHLYGTRSDSSWNAQSLLSAIKTLKTQTSRRETAKDTTLAPLYPQS